MSKKITTQDFIKKAREVHGDKYDYSKVVYVGVDKKVIIFCPIHGDFLQTPHAHLSGYNKVPKTGCGCSSCAQRKQLTTEEFIKRAKEIHGDKYDYSKVNYISNHEKVIIICPCHGDFLQEPSNHLIGYHNDIKSGRGCPDCADDEKKLTTEEFIERAKMVHGTCYDYSKTKYINSYTNVIIICTVHGPFEQRPRCHLDGKRCYECFGNPLKTTQEFIRDAKMIHGDKYDYSKVNYTGTHNRVTITCLTHGPFDQIANSHLNGNGCPNCPQTSYSKGSIEWLKYMEIRDNTKIQHAENGGEFLIPNTRFRVDGYSKELNKVYEYLGDFWHGNPEIYDRDYINARTKETMGELYDNTMRKLEKMNELGYECEAVWETDWLKFKKSQSESCYDS